MENTDSHTFREIVSQPVVWNEATQIIEAEAGRLTAAWSTLQPQSVLFSGCGSTYYLSQTAAAVFQSLTGVTARAAAGSELLLFPELVLSDAQHTLLIAVSRSGATTETLQAIERFRHLGGKAVWGITCSADSDLVNRVDMALVAREAGEQSIVQTRSFSSMLLLAQGIAATIGSRSLNVFRQVPALGQALIEKSMPQMEQVGKRLDLEQIFFLGSGPLHGIASEAMLKMKEMSLSHSEAFHFLEFRHGPRAMVGRDTLIAGLLSTTALVHEQRVLQEMTTLGAEILPLSPDATGTGAASTVEIATQVPNWLRPLLYLPPLQLLAYQRTLSKNLDPDQPRHLDAVVSLDPQEF